MKDRIAVNPGRVLVAPENGAPYYATLTRADNPTQEGDYLNKNTLLKDTTAALFDLDSDAVPDDVLVVLSRFQNRLGNEYVWEKYSFAITRAGTERYRVTDGLWFQVSSNVRLSGDKVELVNPTRVFIDVNSVSGANLAGKYFYIEGASDDTVYVCDRATPSGQYAYVYYYAVVAEKDHASISYVNSPDPNAYPVDDGYAYEALGRIGNKVQIASGRYIGTGSSVSLTFNFVPKILILTRFTYQSGETGSETGYIRGMSENFTSVIDIGALREAIDGEYKYSGTSGKYGITMYSAYSASSTFTLTFTPSNDWKTITFSSSNSYFVAPTRIHTYVAIG